MSKKKNNKSDSSFKIRWESSAIKKEIMNQIVSVKGNVSINQYIKNLIKKDLAKEKGINLFDLRNKIENIDTKLDAIISLDKISEAEVRLLFYAWASYAKINLEKVYSQIDLSSKHEIPVVIKKLFEI